MHAAGFLSKYPNANPFNRTNRTHPRSTLSVTVLRGVSCRCNIVADLTFG
jgi:hypothetical protein